MPRSAFLILVGVVLLVTLLSGAAAIALIVTPRLAKSRHTGKLIQVFADTWKNGVFALIGLLAGFGTR
jgi:hypothetical protein